MKWPIIFIAVLLSAIAIPYYLNWKSESDDRLKQIRVKNYFDSMHAEGEKYIREQDRELKNIEEETKILRKHRSYQ